MGRPPPRWGWHELQPAWAARLVADAALPAGATVLDIGAGLGALTAPLVASGARVVAVEAHDRRAHALRERFGRGAVVVHTDAADLRLPRHPYHVVANPPFGLTTVLLRRFLQRGSRLQSARLVVQQQAAVRWASPGAPAYARWSVDFAVTLGPVVPAGAFRPPPPVRCRVLVIQRRP